jgi:hypothetical protein
MHSRSLPRHLPSRRRSCCPIPQKALPTSTKIQDRLDSNLAAGLLTENGEYGLVSMETDSSSDSEKVRSNFTIVNSQKNRKQENQINLQNSEVL